jgi:TatA/E family protein of Tat protein translocase
MNMLNMLFSQSPDGHTLAFIEGVGGPEMLLVLVLILVLFGGKGLPEFARGLGRTIREFKKASAGVEAEFKRALEEEPPKPPSSASLEAADMPVAEPNEPLPEPEATVPPESAPCKPR